MDPNPYSSPLADSNSIQNPDDAVSVPTLGAIARVVFLAWERLRLIYLFVLAVVTLLMTGAQLMQLQMLALVLGGAVMANLCFFAGPIIETYVRWLGYQRTWVRWFLFVGGLILSMVLTSAALMPHG